MRRAHTRTKVFGKGKHTEVSLSGHFAVEVWIYARNANALQVYTYMLISFGLLNYVDIY